MADNLMIERCETVSASEATYQDPVRLVARYRHATAARVLCVVHPVERKLGAIFAADVAVQH
jgi:hypothetical protein